MRCARCGHVFAEGLLPARCPSCGARVSSEAGEAEGTRGAASEGRRLKARAGKAAASRKSVEGLTGIGLGNHRAGHVLKAVVRIILGLALVAAFCALVALVLYKTEIIGGRTVPDVTGWRSARAISELSRDGFVTSVVEVETSEQLPDMVVSLNPAPGKRADQGATIVLEVATEPSEAPKE